MTRIDDLQAPTIPRGPSLDSLEIAYLGWLDDPDGVPGAPGLPFESRRPLPTIDEHGLLRQDGRWVSLTPTEERVMRALLARVGRVCSRAFLVEAGWPQGLKNDRMLDSYIRRLRIKIPGFGIEIRTVRKRGFLLGIGGAPA